MDCYSVLNMCNVICFFGFMFEGGVMICILIFLRCIV